MKKIFFSFSLVLAFVVFGNVRVAAKSSSNEVFEVIVGESTLPLYYTLVENQVVFDSNNQEVGNLESNVISMNDGSTYLIRDSKVLDENNEEIGSLSESTITMKNNTIFTLGEKEVKERIQFNVHLKGLSEFSNSYRWEHQLCYKVNGNSEVCEIDITGDSDLSTKILSNGEYPFYFYDGHMPYYSETLEFEYITFKNKFTCLDCETNQEYTLNNIVFSNEEIRYDYSYDLKTDYVENEDKKYVVAYSSSTSEKVYVKGQFVNNSASNIVLEDAPTYKIVNEVCVGEEICVSEEIDKVYSSGDTNSENPLSITPYLGSLNFYYSGSNLLWANKTIEYEFAKFKTTLVCLNNCTSRRVLNTIVLNEEEYYFDYIKPMVDEENTEIRSYEKVEYIKYSDVKITLSDSQSGLDNGRLKYYLVKPYGTSCAWGVTQEYSFINGEFFRIGENLNGGYCMYYVAYDKNGNYYQSNYYIYYFDNNGPVMSFENGYDEGKYYNDIKIDPSFNDGQSGFKEAYYLWSKIEIGEEDYLLVKNNGKLFGSEISSNELSEDGSYYLYFLAYDNLNNYKLYDLGVFNLDTQGLSVNDVIVEKNGFIDGYSNIGTIKLRVNEMIDNEEIKCGFFIDSEVSIEELNYNCNNNKVVSLPAGLEGEYNLFVYVHDKANNYSLLKVAEAIKIDTRSPLISMDVLYDDDNYHLVNEITLNLFDLSGINGSTLKYGWFLASKNNVLGSDLINDFENGVSFGYPVSHYGEYKLYVRAIDTLGNETFKAVDKIFKIDTDIIRISLVGEESVTILKGEKYEELGAKAYKGEVISGGRVSEVKVEGNVDSSKAGIYYVTYTSGEGDLEVSVTRKIIVKNDLTYVTISGCLFIVGALIISLRLFIVRKKEANV